MKKLILLISCGIFLTGGFADSGSQHYKIKAAAKEKLKSESGCPYLDGKRKCPYKNEINKNYIIRQSDILKQIKKT